jgi:hypothetical protein
MADLLSAWSGDARTAMAVGVLRLAREADRAGSTLVGAPLLLVSLGQRGVDGRVLAVRLLLGSAEQFDALALLALGDDQLRAQFGDAGAQLFGAARAA